MKPATIQKTFPALTLLGLAVIALATTATEISRLEAKAASPQTQARDEMVDVGGYRLSIKCLGSGSPTVILEAGLASPSSDWDKVMPEVAHFTRVCSYDRAGVGKSDPAPKSRSGQQVVDALHTLLTKTGEAGPYVLVGHSFGGIYAVLYAHQYPKEVVGMVLVDSSHEDQIARFEAIMTPEQLQQSRSRRAQNAEGVDTNAIRAQVRETRWRSRVPLRVLMHGRVTPDMNPPGWSSEQAAKRSQAWREMQMNWASRSPEGKLVVAEKSGHYIQNDQPELVVDAIREVLTAAKNNLKNARRRK